MSVKAGTHTISLPLGATNPLAIAMALTAWLIAPAPTAWISTIFFSLIIAAKAPATEFGFDFVDTFNTPIQIPPKSFT